MTDRPLRIEGLETLAMTDRPLRIEGLEALANGECDIQTDR